MNTKEVIEFLEKHLKTHKDWRYEVILKCLKRGEKFEAMWKRLKRNNKTVTFFDEMEELEQKYF